MTQRPALDPNERTHRTALWRIAQGRREGNSLLSALATADLMGLQQQPAAEALRVTVDTVTDGFAVWADEIGVNPACLAEEAYSALAPRIDEVARLILLVAAQLLHTADPTGESGSQHAPCSPWPAETSTPSLGQPEHQEVLLQGAAIGMGIEALRDEPALRMCMAAPDLLLHLAWGRSGSDEKRMGELVRAAAA